MNEESCIFCKIIKNEIPSNKIFEDDKSLAFLDIFPINEGHTIVIPKEHFKNIEEIPLNELSRVFSTVKKTAILLHKKLNIGGYNILQNNYKPAGQVIEHFHIHIIPRNENDEKIKLEIPINQASEEDLNNILKRVRD